LLSNIEPAEFLNRAITYACRWQGLPLGTAAAEAEAATMRQIAADRTTAFVALGYTESEAEPMGEGMDADDAGQDGV
jgi:Holliday junction resolvasome RuvABC DNA-binding subunit